MPEETQAVSSPAEVADPFNGATDVTAAEANQYALTQELPSRFKPADEAVPAAADSQTPAANANEDSPESASEAGTDNDSQEPKQPKGKTAEERKAYFKDAIAREWDKPVPDAKFIAQAEATLEKIEAGQKRKTEPAPVAQPQAPPQANPQYAHPKPTQYDTNPDGTLKYKEFEDVVEAIGRWAAREERAQWERELAEREALKRYAAREDEARQRFGEKFDSVIKPKFVAILSNPDIPEVIKDILRQSDVENLMDRFSNDAQAEAKFFALVKSDGYGTVKYIGELEAAARRELSGQIRNEKGQFAAEAPEPKKTSAPKPPSPVGGASLRAFDVNDDDLPTDEWHRKRNQQLAQKKG